MCLNYTCIIFVSFNLRLHMFHMQFCCFASATVAHGIIVLLKKSISYFMNIMYKRIFLNFGVILFINIEMVSLFQLHTYKFGLVYMQKAGFLIVRAAHCTTTFICRGVGQCRISLRRF